MRSEKRIHNLRIKRYGLFGEENERRSVRKLLGKDAKHLLEAYLFLLVLE
jgi:hypothetical protein